jgi:hypothetical protein
MLISERVVKEAGVQQAPSKCMEPEPGSESANISFFLDNYFLTQEGSS